MTNWGKYLTKKQIDVFRINKDLTNQYNGKIIGKSTKIQMPGC